MRMIEEDRPRGLPRIATKLKFQNSLTFHRGKKKKKYPTKVGKIPWPFKIRNLLTIFGNFGPCPNHGLSSKWKDYLIYSTTTSKKNGNSWTIFVKINLALDKVFSPNEKTPWPTGRFPDFPTNFKVPDSYWINFRHI